MTFKTKLVAIQTAAVLLIVSFSLWLTHSVVSEVVASNKSEETRVIASSIALNPDVVQAVANHNRDALNVLLNQYDIQSMDYIVAASKNGERLFHSGQQLATGIIGGDVFKRVIDGETITLVGKGISGLSIKTRTPVYNDGKVIGVIAVGIAESHRADIVLRYLAQAAVMVGLMMLALLGSTRLFARYIDRQLSGMTPEEIAHAFQLRKGILNSVAEGVVAVDGKGQILVINNQAMTLLGIEEPKNKLIGSNVKNHIYPWRFFSPEEVNPLPETVITFNGESFIASRTVMHHKQHFVGFVISFRRRNNSAMLALMANHAARERDDLRVITHEYANNMAVVSGMIEMGMYDQALGFIRKENSSLQQHVSELTEAFHPVIAALILGKSRRASELNIHFELLPNSSLKLEHSPLGAQEIAAIIGNLTDNAFDATLKTDRRGIVQLLAIESDKELMIEVSDNGTGIHDNEKDLILQSGYSHKEEDGTPHGVGLALIEELVTGAGGYILIDDNDEHGAIVSVFIPVGRNYDR